MKYYRLWCAQSYWTSNDEIYVMAESVIDACLQCYERFPHDLVEYCEEITEDEHGLHIEINNLDDIFMVIFLAGEDVIISRIGIGNYKLYVYDDYME